MASEDFPEELENACKNFESAMLKAEDAIKPLLQSDKAQLLRNADDLDAAKYDLAAVYSINSLYWAYLIIHGVDPKKHAVKQELDRIRLYMSRLEEIKNKKNAPKLMKDTARRFIRNALFDSDQKLDDAKNLPEVKPVSEQETTSTSANKRKANKKNKFSKKNKF